MLNKNSLELFSVFLIATTLADTFPGRHLNEGESCVINSTAQDGICTKKHLCKQPCAAKEMTFELCKETPKRKAPIVCCPKERQGSARISAKKCMEYKELACSPEYVNAGIDGGQMESKVSKCATHTKPVIINGEAAQTKEFPHMALLRWADNDTMKCAGTLISDQFVLTAAHCLKNAKFQVRLGEHDQKVTNESQHIDVNVSETFIPIDYQSPRTYNDIGLIKLDRPVKFTDAIRPACLPEEAFTDDIVNVTATGWGLTEQLESSTILMKVNLDVFDDNRCIDSKDPNRYFPQGINISTQFCAGSETRNNNTCNGDSGGPLQVPHKYHYCTFTIVGVTSTGGSGSCVTRVDSSIGVYTRVFSYLDWIERIVWPEESASQLQIEKIVGS